VCQGARLVIPEKEAREKGTALKVLPDQYSHFAAEELKRFRRELAQDLGVPPFIIFNDATLFGLAAALPSNEDEFLRVKGTGASRWERFGPRILDICKLARAAGDVPQRTAVAVKRRR
jgi:ATP-dependent DNA helicase RecQ